MKFSKLQPLLINKTKESPQIELNPENNFFSIEGRSFPSDAVELYKPILAWLRSYVEDPNEVTLFQFKLDYFNSISQKYFFEILICLKKIIAVKKELIIEWHFQNEDIDMQEIGQEFEYLCEVSFEFKSY